MVVSIFDHSAEMVKPWADAGYTCYCVDMQHARGEARQGNIVKVGANAMDWLPPKGKIAAAFFFPPCTDLASSGARWFRDKGLGALIRGLELFKRSVDLAEMIGAPYLIENPTGTVSTYWRRPDYEFDPCDYGDPYTKKTCLWTGGGFVMPPKNRVEPLMGSMMHTLPQTADRANIRSKTPGGFARAVYQANAIEELLK